MRSIVNANTIPGLNDRKLGLAGVGPSSVEQHTSTQARDEVLWEMQRCNAFAVEFHRWRDDWLARRATT
jgi:hypothetical protein